MAGKLPDFDDLPPVKGMPQGCAWGIFDKGGKKDVFGTLNLLTPDVIKEAYKEARDGVHISLNWPIGAIKTPGFGRKGLVHKVLSLEPLGCAGFDDEIEFNTQCSSQWDSLCHFHHQPTGTAYNGVKTNIEQLTQTSGDEDSKMEIPTLNHWHKRGGMVARGVFIDYRRYVDQNGIKFNPFDADVISIADLEKVAKLQNVEFHPGDVLIIRSGFTEGLTGLDGPSQEQAMSSHRVCGVESSVAAAKWIWNKHFSAVAGDMIAFEHIPPKIGERNNEEGGINELVLHQYLIALFGMSIGELWDLKALSDHCAKTGRYSFLLSSVPLNVPGGIGSPPNAIAMF